MIYSKINYFINNSDIVYCPKEETHQSTGPYPKRIDVFGLVQEVNMNRNTETVIVLWKELYLTNISIRVDLQSTPLVFNENTKNSTKLSFSRIQSPVLAGKVRPKTGYNPPKTVQTHVGTPIGPVITLTFSTGFSFLNKQNTFSLHLSLPKNGSL